MNLIHIAPFAVLSYSIGQILVNECLSKIAKIVNEYDQEIQQSQTADNPVAPRGRAAQPSRDVCSTRMDIK